MFEKFLIAYPALDITYKNVQSSEGNFSIDISPSDFVGISILRLMSGSACVGVSFLLELENGSLVPWTFMQGYSTDPHIWCPFNDSPDAPILFDPNTLFKIEEIISAQNLAEIAIKAISVEETAAELLIDCDINVWTSQFNQDSIYVLVRTLRRLLSRQSIYAIHLDKTVKAALASNDQL